MLSLFLSACLGVSHAPPEGPKAPPAASSLRPGMTAAQVLDLLGPPKRVARQVIYKRCLEQWIYDVPSLRIELDSVQGQLAHVLSVHSIRPSPP